MLEPCPALDKVVAGLDEGTGTDLGGWKRLLVTSTRSDSNVSEWGCFLFGGGGGCRSSDNTKK